MRLLAAAATIALVAASPAAAQSVTENWRLDGFATPEGARYDEANDRIVVSNMANNEPGAGADGYLSLVSTEGELIEEQWVTGLEDPKGLAFHDGTLYVADNPGLVAIDAATGEILDTYTVEGLALPNDVTVGPDGAIYLTDTFANAIYRFADGSLELWLQDEDLASPNGIYYDGEQLLIGGLGRNIQPDFTTDSPGGLLAVDLDTQEITPAPNADEIGFLDGVAPLGDGVVFSEFMAGGIYLYEWGGEPELVTELGTGAAAIGTAGDAIIVPLMMEGAVVSLSVD